TAVAAGAAWLVVQPFGGVADHYAYYSPLGAVVVMSTAVMASVRTGLQAVFAIGLGAGLAVLALQLPVPRVLGLMAVVGVGTGLATWRRLGTMGVWVPFAGLFVLLVGGSSNPTTYILGYAGLTAVGAAVGILVNLVAPQLPLGRTLQAMTMLKDELSRQLREVANDLGTEEDLGADSERISSFLEPRKDRLERLVSEVRESRRANWRAGRWRGLAERREAQAKALETLAYLVEEVSVLLAGSTTRMRTRRSPVGDAIAQALTATAAMLDQTDLTGSPEDPVPSAHTRDAVEHLRQVVLDQYDEPDYVLVGSSVTVSLERAIQAWE
ncbi:MAG TPA: hypothetical protein VFE86_04865, partial [Ilumatobacteraceae bacterium]|nr:hypothetical protein [Ilumatobacteraceae bacterium]